MNEVQRVFAVVLVGWCASAGATPSFCLPDRLYAVVGVPCSVYFARVFDSVRFQNYAFEAEAEVGNHWMDRWSWTPTEEDEGTSRRLVLNAWTDDGCVASATTTVFVARRPSDSLKARKITLALFGSSGTNARYQDQLQARMRAAGFSAYTPVGSHTGRSSSLVCNPAEGAPHDGYGGFAFGDFLNRYSMSVDEIDNLQAEAEREQLLSFGVKIPPGQEWRRGLLKSPIVRLKDGKKVVDVQAWLDKINGGKAPDYLVIVLGGNGIATIRRDRIETSVSNQLASARKLVQVIHEACPKTVIAITGATGGSILQTGWGKNYGATISAFQGNRNRILYDRAVEAYVKSANDPLLRFIPLAQNLDPVGVYPQEEAKGNALHSSEEGGKMVGDALFAGLLNDLTEAESAKEIASERTEPSSGFELAQRLTVPRVWTSANGETLPYRLHLPANPAAGARYPLVLHLHGAGSRGTNNVDQIRAGGADFIHWARKNGHEFVFLAPQCPKGLKWVDTDWHATEHRMAKQPTPQLRMVMELLDDALARYPIDRSRVYVIGISMGGFGTWEMLQRRPELFAAAIPCCGGGDVTRACTLTDIAIWAFHGAEDKVVPTVRSRGMFEAVRGALSQKIRYREYPGAGHAVWTQTFSDPAVLKWLWSQRREPPTKDGPNFSAIRCAGVPRLAVNGAACVGTAAMPSPKVAPGKSVSALADFDRQGVRFYSDIWMMNDKRYLPRVWWRGEGDYDFVTFDALAKGLLDATPQGFVFPRIKLDPPESWISAHPEEMFAGTVRPESAAWRKLYRQMLRDLVAHVDAAPYADRIAGYHLGALHCGEWVFHGADYQLSLPSDPTARQARSREITRHVAEAVVDAARVMRELTHGRKLIGSFFGYASYAHEDLFTVLDSKTIDFFAAPPHYRLLREPGHSGRSQAYYQASYRLHGSVYYEESDFRTFLSDPTCSFPPQTRMRPLDETLALMRRSIGKCLAGGWENWWFLLGGNATYSHPDMLSTVRLGLEEQRRSLHAVWKPADVAVFTSPNEFATSGGAPDLGLRSALKVRMQTEILPACGVSYDSYVLEDIANPDLPEYSVYFFPNAFTLTPELAAAIDRLTKRPGKAAIWIRKGDPVPDAIALRERFRAAGAHVWIESGDVLAAGRGYLMVHASTDGEKSICLPQTCDVREVFGLSPERKGVRAFVETLRTGETRVYSLLSR